MQALRWAVLVLAVASALAFLALAVIAFNQQFFDLDHTTHDVMRASRYPELRPLMQLLSRIGSGYVLIPLCVVLYVWLRRQSHRAARYIPGMFVGAMRRASLRMACISSARKMVPP